MKILDRYVAKNFLIGYAIAFCVLIGLRIVIDLFVNLDEFTERPELSAPQVVRNILNFYSLHTTLYFRDFAGMITVVAAAFSLGKMVRSNELVVMMASGVSLKRVIGPIVILSLLLTGLVIIDQELVIPRLGDKLVRSQDAIPGEEVYDVWFMSDAKGSLISSFGFDVGTATLNKLNIITRRREPNQLFWEVTGIISADQAPYNPATGKWSLINGRLFRKSEGSLGVTSEPLIRQINEYESDITPRDIPIRRKAKHIPLLSWRQLSRLAAQKTKIKDVARLYSERHFRITEPIINLAMLLLCLPILVCRDPKSMKSAVMISFVLVGVCFVTTFVCKMFATEVVFDKIRPELWAWVPVFVFLPIAFVELDSMKT